MWVCEMVALRDAYGEHLKALGERYPDVVVLDADLARSTKSEKFGSRFPDRFFDLGIAEQNLVGVAAGLALGGKIPIVNSFATFLTERAFNQIRQSVAYPMLNVKLCGAHGGVSAGGDGASHQTYIDLALMRSLPNMTVLVPCDATETVKALEAMLEHHGPVYLRLGKIPLPVLFDDSYTFRIGKPVIMREGEDVTIFACGTMVGIALKAAEALRQLGVSASVVNVHTVKPLDAELVVDVSVATGTAVVIEEHSVIGGLGSAICEVLGPQKNVSTYRIGVPDVFGESGSPAELLSLFGLTERHVVTRVTEILSAR